MFAQLGRIEDPAVRDALKVIWEAVSALQKQAQEIGSVSAPLDDHLDANKKQLRQVANPSHPLDAVNFQTLVNYTRALLVTPQTTSGTAAGSGGAGSGSGGLSAGCDSPPPNGDIGSGAPTFDRAVQVVCGVGQEWSALLLPAASSAARDANVTEFCSRVIWHLQQAGFVAGKQQNPSGVISNNKITIQLDDAVMHAFDVIASANDPSVEAHAHVNEVFPANYVADAGTAD